MVEILMASAIAQMEFRQRSGRIPAPLSRSDLARLITCVALMATAVGALGLIGFLSDTDEPQWRQGGYAVWRQ